eukprot:TRINITY_DN2310_c0_g1_i2.p1 TRINITY_DN2310_c0_g1~~TRINITY_DN2310_c0_g1_i2.p1  ORF type:complete len:269 (+),score=49.31 TRINITY_DN2310_c0_g1_i2:47-853(+)
MSGEPAEDLFRGVKSLALSAGQQLSNWKKSIAWPWDLDRDATQRWIKQKQERGQSKQERPAGFLRRFGLPGAGFLPSRDRHNWPKEERDAGVSDRALVQDVQDAREAEILDAETRSGQLNQQLTAASYGVINGLTVDLQKAELEVKSGNAVSKEELGRATWTFLHTLAAQFPENPTRQQQRDVKELMLILSRMYPCKVCAEHFRHILRTNPVQAGSGPELAHWMCRVHNVVNRSLGKPQFACKRVDARWGALECDDGACDLEGRMYGK